MVEITPLFQCEFKQQSIIDKITRLTENGENVNEYV